MIYLDRLMGYDYGYPPTGEAPSTTISSLPQVAEERVIVVGIVECVMQSKNCVFRRNHEKSKKSMVFHRFS